MTYEEVVKLSVDRAEADEEHNCPERNGEDFVRCEICERARQAGDKLMFNWRDLVELLEREHEANSRLTLRVIQDVPPDERTPELQAAMLHSLHTNREAKASSEGMVK